MLYLHDSLKPYFSDHTALFDQLMSLNGDKFRALEGRLTQRVRIGDHTYFIKQHRGVGWKEIFKNLFQLKLPVLGARNEWQALQVLATWGISAPKAMAYGERGVNPANKESFILMQDLKDTISLEDLGKQWCVQPPKFGHKKQIIEEVARIAKTMHSKGMNHRDFYICHFLMALDEPFQLSLIDLHRAQIRSVTSQRWIVKDLAALYFSSKDIGLTKRDLYRFMKKYSGKTLREIFCTETDCWQKVKIRGEQLYRDHT